MRSITLVAVVAPLCLLAADLQTAEKSITPSGLMKHIKVLASDEYEGRAPASHGEDLTVKYLTDQFKSMGLKPGNPNGTYVQDVPMWGIRSVPSATLSVKGKPIPITWKQDFVAWTIKPEPEVKVSNTDIVFVGYGVVAPEYGWDDYKGVDVKGKTIVMLVNDPAVPDPNDPSKLDEKMFRGKAMTYYGRWTYKYEIASEKGAAAAIIVHETGPAGYPFEVVINSNSAENFDIVRADRNRGRVPVQAWMTFDKAKELFSAAGQNLDALKKAAVRKDFRPVTLAGAKASFALKNTVREVRSKNVVAKLEGSDPKLRNEYVIYTAHWDHLGKDPGLKGDQIYNGALDNASGTAALLEIANAFTKVTPAPKRSILFLSVTAEEKGLIGAKYYAENPLYPLNKTLADINMDGINQWGKTRDITIVGYGNSTLDDIVNEIAAREGRKPFGDPEPEKGHFYRSDHFEFAKQGVPAIDPGAGIDFIGKPSGWGKKKREEYVANDYHKPSDQIKPDWDFSGAVQDLDMLMEVGYRVAQSDKLPEWKAGTEFRAKRESMLKAK